MTIDEVQETLRIRLKDTYRSAEKRSGSAAEHTLTLDELIEVYNSQDGRCAVLGIPLTGVKMQGSKYVNDNRWTGLSVDRLDCNRGYHADNIRLTCWAINAMRGTLPEAEAERQAFEFIETIKSQ